MSFRGSGWVGREAQKAVMKMIGPKMFDTYLSQIYRYWEEDGGWLKAYVSAWDAVTGEHTLTYMSGTDEEAAEEVNLDTVEPEEMQLPEDRVRNILSIGQDSRIRTPNYPQIKLSMNRTRTLTLIRHTIRQVNSWPVLRATSNPNYNPALILNPI